MALTFTADTDPITAAKVWVQGDKKVVSGLVTFDSSYPTGGEAYTAALFGFDQVLHHVEVEGVTLTGSGGRLIVNDHANKKLKLFTAMSTEAANASDQSAVTARVTAYGE